MSKWFLKYEKLNSKIKISNNSFFNIFISVILKFRNIGRSTFGRFKIWPPPFALYTRNVAILTQLGKKRTFVDTNYVRAYEISYLHPCETCLRLFIQWFVRATLVVSEIAKGARSTILSQCFANYILQSIGWHTSCWSKEGPFLATYLAISLDFKQSQRGSPEGEAVLSTLASHSIMFANLV